MKHYSMEQVKNIRGFDALTQGEERLEDLLLSNINGLGGKKAVGFIKTRKHVLNEEFDTSALSDFISLSINIINSGLATKGNVLLKSIGKILCEKIMRDFVPTDMVEKFCMTIIELLRIFDDSIEDCANVVKGYFTCGKVVSIAQTFREVEIFLETGEIIYEPISA